MGSHLDADCMVNRVQCPLGCGVMILRVRKAIHIAQECPRTVVMCPVADCKFTGRRETLEGHATDRALAHVCLLQHQNASLNLRVATGMMKRSDARLIYGEIKVMKFTIRAMKTKIVEGIVSFVSPAFTDVFNGKWQITLRKEDTGGWHIYLCLLSMALPLHLKVMFLLQSPNGREEDHAIVLGGTVKVIEGKMYGAPVPQQKLEEYSTMSQADELVLKVIMQEVSAVAKSS
ncbi:uncharacterized protein LOC144877833 [Branchiostoma floridae x Branchiostoma japonicum]